MFIFLWFAEFKNFTKLVLFGLQSVVVVEHGPVVVRPRHLDAERPRRSRHPSRCGLERRHRRLFLPLLLLRRFELEPLHQRGEEEEDLEIANHWLLSPSDFQTSTRSGRIFFPSILCPDCAILRYLAGGQRLGGTLSLARRERYELVRPRHLPGVSIDEPLGIEPLRLDPPFARRLVENPETRLDSVGLGDSVGADLGMDTSRLGAFI